MMNRLAVMTWLLCIGRSHSLPYCNLEILDRKCAGKTKLAVVTGGTSGNGLSIAYKFATQQSDDYCVIITGRGQYTDNYLINRCAWEANPHEDKQFSDSHPGALTYDYDKSSGKIEVKYASCSDQVVKNRYAKLFDVSDEGDFTWPTNIHYIQADARIEQEIANLFSTCLETVLKEKEWVMVNNAGVIPTAVDSPGVPVLSGRGRPETTNTESTLGDREETCENNQSGDHDSPALVGYAGRNYLKSFALTNSLMARRIEPLFTDMFGAYFGTQYARFQQSGHLTNIINIASQNAVEPSPTGQTYSMAKYAIIALTQSVQGSPGVDFGVDSVNPPAVNTPLMRVQMCNASVSYGKVKHETTADEYAQCWIAAATPKTQDEQRCLDKCKCTFTNNTVDCKACAEQHGTDPEMTACMRGYSKIQALLETIPNHLGRSKDGSISPNTVADAVVRIVGIGKESSQTIDIKFSHHDAGHWEQANITVGTHPMLLKDQTGIKQGWFWIPSPE